MKAWLRILTINFTSTKLKKKITFGENYKNNKEDLNISVTLNKYMSPLKDSCSIKILIILGFFRFSKKRGMVGKYIHFYKTKKYYILIK